MFYSSEETEENLDKNASLLKPLLKCLKVDLWEVINDLGNPSLLEELCGKTIAKKRLDEVEITVTLCESCRKNVERTSELFQRLEKVQMELDYCLKCVHNGISETLSKNYFPLMSNGGTSISVLVLVDELRKKILKQSKICIGAKIEFCSVRPTVKLTRSRKRYLPIIKIKNEENICENDVTTKTTSPIQRIIPEVISRVAPAVYSNSISYSIGIGRSMKAYTEDDTPSKTKTITASVWVPPPASDVPLVLHNSSSVNNANGNNNNDDSNEPFSQILHSTNWLRSFLLETVETEQESQLNLTNDDQSAKKVINATSLEQHQQNGKGRTSSTSTSQRQRLHQLVDKLWIPPIVPFPRNSSDGTEEENFTQKSSTDLNTNEKLLPPLQTQAAKQRDKTKRIPVKKHLSRIRLNNSTCNASTIAAKNKFKCGVCAKTFIWKSALQKHRTISHRNRNERILSSQPHPFLGSGIQKPYHSHSSVTTEDLNRHNEIMAKEYKDKCMTTAALPIQKYPCIACSKSFGVFRDLELHFMEAHTR